MTITPIGYIFIPLGLLLFLFSKRALLKITLLCLCFSGTIIGGMPDKQLSISLFNFLTFFWILREFIDYSLRNKKNLTNLSLSVFLLLLFGFCAIFSTLNAFFYDGLEYLTPTSEGYFKINYLNFSFWNIFNTWILIQNIIFSILLAHFIINNGTNNIIKYYFFSLIILICFVFIEIANFYLDLNLPLHYFNNIYTSEYGGEFLSRLSGSNNLLRVSSLSEEPSFLAFHLLTGLSFVIAANTTGNVPFIKKRYLLYILLFIFSIILTLSTTGYIGLFLLLLFNFFLTYKLKFLKMVIPVVIILYIVNLMALAYIPEYALIQNLVLNEFIFEKLVSGSFQIRLQTIIEGFQIYLQAPLFGIGWGVLNPNDLVIKIAAGTGTIGLVVFFCMISSVLRDYKIVKKFRANDKNSKISQLYFLDNQPYVVTFLLVLIISELIGFHYRLGEIWFFIALLISGRLFIESIEKRSI